jgi:hypothetical protein
MMAQKTLKSLLDPKHGVPYDEDFDAMTLARNLMSGSLTENCKTDSEGFEINLKKDYSLSDLLADQPTVSADEYYSVPYKSTMWGALEEAGAEKARKGGIAAVPGDTLQEKLDFLLKCDCCERHSQDKPQSLNDRVACCSCTHERYEKNGCECKCRHMARWIAKEHQKTK